MSEDLNIETKGLSLKQVLKRGDYFVIPTYQRDYVWSEDDIEVLILSLYGGYKRDMDKYVGTLIVHDKSNTLDISYDWFDIVDGQQRLLTFMLMLIGFVITKKVTFNKVSKYISVNELDEDKEFLGGGLYSKIQSYDDSVSNYLNSLILGLSNKNSDIISDYFKLNHDDSVTLKRLKQNLKFIVSKFEIIEVDSNIDYSFFDYFLNRIKVVFVSTFSIDVALDLFNSVNTTGVKLTPADIFKSNLLNSNNIGVYKVPNSSFYSFGITNTIATNSFSDVLKWTEMQVQIDDFETNIGSIKPQTTGLYESSAWEQFLNVVIILISKKLFKTASKSISYDEFLKLLKHSDITKADVFNEIVYLYESFMSNMINLEGKSLFYKTSLINLRGNKYTQLTSGSLLPLLSHFYNSNFSSDDVDLFMKKMDLILYFHMMLGNSKVKQNLFSSLVNDIVLTNSSVDLIFNKLDEILLNMLNESFAYLQIKNESFESSLRKLLSNLFNSNTESKLGTTLSKLYNLTLKRYVVGQNKDLLSDDNITSFLSNLYNSSSLLKVTDYVSSIPSGSINSIGNYIVSNQSASGVKNIKGKIWEIIQGNIESSSVIILSNQFNTNDYINSLSNSNIIDARTNHIIDFIITEVLEAFPKLG